MHEEMDRLFGRVFSRPLLGKGKELAPFRKARVPVSDIKESEKNVKKKGIYSYQSSASQFYRKIPLPAEK